MKKRYLVFGLLASALSAYAQKPSTGYKQESLAKTEIEALFSFYDQQGVHSAVTGGTGTEKLQVYAPQLSINHHVDSSNRVKLNVGADVISSASTDKIDFVVSSASVVDTRSHVSVGYSRDIKSKRLTVDANVAASIESDYFSVGPGIGVSYQSKSGEREISANILAYFDDLRWGRLYPGLHKPVTLIYPEELRFQDWYEEYHRNSYNFSFGFRQVLNKRMILGVFPGVVYQEGLLATPFHRVYFMDSSLKVENLPNQRWKLPVGVQLNSFIGNRLILKSFYRFYWDDFGVLAHTFRLESAVKLSPMLTLTPFGRFYTQQGTSYFSPYRQHSLDESYYTSDYDLSTFNSYKVGIEFRIVPFKSFGRRMIWNEMGFRYAYYNRSDGLSAHMLSMLVGITRGAQRIKK